MSRPVMCRPVFWFDRMGFHGLCSCGFTVASAFDAPAVHSALACHVPAPVPSR